MPRPLKLKKLPPGVVLEEWPFTGPAAPAPRSKYNAQRTTVGGVTFASKKEANRYAELRLLEKAGKIFGLETQPPFPVVLKGTKVFVYKADFRYRAGRGKRAAVVVEDVKGVRTAVYRLKKKIVEVEFGITIKEV